MQFDFRSVERLTGLSLGPGRIKEICHDLPDLHYTPLSKADSVAFSESVRARIRNRDYRVIGTEDDHAVWERGWSEVARTIGEDGTPDVESLKPQYFRTGEPLRLFGEYVHPDTDFFEYYVGIAVRRILMRAHLSDSRSILELGCGTGVNLLLAMDLFQDAEIACADWSEASLSLAARIGRARSRPITARLHNMITGEGEEALPIAPHTDILTVHALEQLGDNAERLLEVLLARRPRRVLHIEPISEFYDSGDPFDAIALKYHQDRGYLQGLRGFVTKKAAAGALEILASRRVPFGNAYHEAYSCIAWRPI